MATPIEAKTPAEKERLNWFGHLGFGLAWGAGYGFAASQGLRGQKAVNAVFAALWPADILGGTASRIYHPTTWFKRDWLIDIIDKYVHIEATGAAFDRLLDGRNR